MKKEGLRYNDGKVRLDLITPEMTEGIGTVLTKGAQKYAERNWENGMAWTKVIASLKRHLLELEKGDDFDRETGLLHVNHILCNAGFLATYYRTHPELDDRPRTYFKSKIALDIDGVIADFNAAAKNKLSLDKHHNHWVYSYSLDSKFWEEVKKDKSFWLDMPAYFDGSDIPFEPVCYVTQRPIPKEWVEEWLEKNNFPCSPVHVISGSKVDLLKKMVVEEIIDWFVDDKYENFIELNESGVFTYLYSQPWNEKYDVGHKRIQSLREIV